MGRPAQAHLRPNRARGGNVMRTPYIRNRFSCSDSAVSNNTRRGGEFASAGARMVVLRVADLCAGCGCRNLLQEGERQEERVP